MADDPETNDPSNPWGLEPQESGFVAFWPHAEPPTMEEVTGAMATWVGDLTPAAQPVEVSAEGEDPDGDEGDDSLDGGAGDRVLDVVDQFQHVTARHHATGRHRNPAGLLDDGTQFVESFKNSVHGATLQISHW